MKIKTQSSDDTASRLHSPDDFITIVYFESTKNIRKRLDPTWLKIIKHLNSSLMEVLTATAS